jgi:putative ABC transport system permease protein
MRSLRVWTARLAASLGLQGATSADDFDAELASHLALHVDDLTRAGMAPEEARRNALLALGGRTQTVELHRAQRTAPLFEALVQDVKYAIRGCLRTPLFAATIVATLAVGIGANSAIFSVVNAVLLKPLPFRDPDRLVMIFATAGTGRQGSFDVVNYPDFADWSNRNRTLEAAAAFAPKAMTMTLGDRAVRTRGMRVTRGLFDVLGAGAAIGRAFLPREQDAGANRVAILSDALRRKWFDGSTDVIGRTLRLDDEPYVIVGVMPAGFRLDQLDTEELYIPLPIDPARGHSFLRVVARMKPGVTVQMVQADLGAIAADLGRIYPRTNDGLGVNVMPMSTATARDVRFGLWLMLGVVTVVLLIACANVGGLMLARGVWRRRELAVRAALGAGRGRLLRQLLTETLVLAIAGGAAGLVVAEWASAYLGSVLASQFRVPRVDTTRVDFAVLIFTMSVAVLIGVACGVLPSMTSAVPDLDHELRDGGRSTTGTRAPRLRRAMVVAETALALMLLAGAGTLLKTFLALRSTDPGFDASQLLVVDSWQPRPRFAAVSARAQFYEAALERVRALPGVRSAAFVADLPLHDGVDSLGFRLVRGDAAPPRVYSLHSGVNIATSDYFKAMKTPVLAGREFMEADGTSSAPVAVVNDVAAKRFWPTESALGQRIGLPGSDNHETVLTVVGVTGNVRHMALDEPARPEIFLNSLQADLQWPGQVLVVRVDGNPVALAGPVEAAIKSIDPGVPIERPIAMDEVIARSIAAPRVYTFLLAVFAAIALVLAAIGLFGLVSYSVSQRTHEIGVRMALGAARQEIVRLVLSEGLPLAGCGALLGLAGSLAVNRLLGGLFRGVEPGNPITLAGVTALLLLTALLASYLPARRAASVDPTTALRNE